MKRPPRKRAKPRAVLVAPAGDGGGGGDGSNDSNNTGARRGTGSVGSGSIGMKKSIGHYDALLRDVYNGDEGALDIIAAAQKRGEKSALKCMGKFYMQKSPTVALRYFEQAAAGSDGDPEAMYMVYSMHKQGTRARAPSTKHTSLLPPPAPAPALVDAADSTAGPAAPRSTYRNRGPTSLATRTRPTPAVALECNCELTDKHLFSCTFRRRRD